MAMAKDGRFEYKLVILMRRDLDISCGKAIAQGAHAAVMCALECRKRKPTYFRRWYEEGQRKVVLSVQDLHTLETLLQKARQADLTAVYVTDAGLTEVPPGTVTCGGIGPGPANVVDRITGSLPLYR